MVAAYTLSFMEGYVTLPQLAARLGTQTTGGLRTDIIRGKLKAEKFGPIWVVTEAEADRYVKEHRNKPGPKPTPLKRDGVE